jgi:hypothetical protein
MTGYHSAACMASQGSTTDGHCSADSGWCTEQLDCSGGHAAGVGSCQGQSAAGRRSEHVYETAAGFQTFSRRAPVAPVSACSRVHNVPALPDTESYPQVTPAAATAARECLGYVDGKA